MQKKYKMYLLSSLAIAALLVSVFTTGAVFAKGTSSTTRTSSNVKVSAKKVSASAATGFSANMSNLPKETSAQAKNHTALPVRTSPKLAQAKQAAATNKNAPQGNGALSGGASSKKFINGFPGMADSATICPYFGGCEPPDMALATSPTEVMQGVNTSFAFYTPSGKLVAGPFNEQAFFGIPNPSPSGCDPAGPFTSDPRAFYDPNDGYFWAAMLQVEGAGGIAPGCNFQSKAWIANINAHTGAMCVYSFDEALGTNNFADYTQIGFNGSTVAWNFNMFNNAGTAYEYDEVQFANKQTMEQCKPVTPTAFTKLSATGPTGVTVLVDTVQPVDTETTAASDPGALYLVNSFNMNGDPFGDDCLFTACQGFLVWGYNPATQVLAGTFVTTGVPNPTYIVPANADEPGCFQCVETIDTRITGTPVYSVGGGEGLITFSLDTSVNNGGAIAPSVVPGILWGQIQVTNFAGGPFANLFQSGYLYFSGDRATSFGAEMQDKNGNMFMVFDTMSASLNPSIMIASRTKSAPLGTLGNVHFIIKGPSATFDTRWGDYEAASYTGFGSNHVWVASQYSASGDWNTFIAQVS